MILSEQFKREYRDYLSKEFDRELNEANTGLESAYIESQKSLKLLEDYFDAFNAMSNLSEANEPGRMKVGDSASTATIEKEDKDAYKKTDDTQKMLLKTIGSLASMIEKTKTSEDERINYTPETMFVEVKRFSDMKFPQNIIFFIKQLIAWIKNLVIAFISKISNAVRRLVGLDTKEDKVDLTLKLNQVKKIENSGTGITKKVNQFLNLIPMSKDDIKLLDQEGIFESFELFTEDDKLKSDKDINKMPKTYALEIDISSNMDDLNVLVGHFFNIFDNSYGSQGEFLFGTDDLEILFKIFEKTMSELKDGSMPTYEIRGRTAELVAVDRERLRVNLEKTLVNTENLKKVYSEIVNRINNTLKIITHKQLIAATDMGVSFRFYSAATYKAMDSLLKLIDPRVEEAESYQKSLEKMKSNYEKITIQLGKMQQAFGAMSGVTYETVHSRTIRNLFDAARITTQTVTLRLTTISLYLKCIKDVREAIRTANAVNESSKNAFKDIFTF